jgi:geranylgeranyl pyrophosphate synthase
VASINKLYGNKMAVLAGDFLLARASVRYTGHQIAYSYGGVMLGG